MVNLEDLDPDELLDEFDDFHPDLSDAEFKREMTLLDWEESHHLRFGDTVNFFGLRQVLSEQELIEAIKKALDTEQPITDEDYDTAVPDGADS